MDERDKPENPFGLGGMNEEKGSGVTSGTTVPAPRNPVVARRVSLNSTAAAPGKARRVLPCGQPDQGAGASVDGHLST